MKAVTKFSQSHINKIEWPLMAKIYIMSILLPNSSSKSEVKLKQMCKIAFLDHKIAFVSLFLYKKGDNYSPTFGCIPRPALPPHMKHLSSNILETLKMKNISSLKLRNFSLETLFYQKWGSNFYFSDIFKNKSWNDTATILTILRYLCTFWGS